MTTIPEEWRIIPGTEQGYAATPDGDIVRLPRTVYLTREGKRVIRKYGMKTLKQSTRPSGHRTVGINVDGLPTVQRVHRLVCTAFHGPPPAITHSLVRHLDGNPRNNRPENLKWGTSAENARDTSWHALQRANGFDPSERKLEDPIGVLLAARDELSDEDFFRSVLS